MRGEDWLFYKVYLGRYVAQFDHACVQLSRKLLNATPVKRWFFMRYADAEGPHIRMRWIPADKDYATAEARFEDLVEELLSDMVYLPPSDYRPMVNLGHAGETGGEQQEFMTSAFCVKEEYRPEYEPFLGPDMLEIAHDLFQVSSEIALELISREMEGGASRKSLAPLLMKITADAFCDERANWTFFQEYCDYWLQQNVANFEHLVPEFTDKAAALEEQGYEIEAIPSSQEDLAARWRTAVREAAQRYGDHIPDEREFPDNLAFRFVHLTNNRLGIGVLDEAYLSTVVGALGRQKA